MHKTFLEFNDRAFASGIQKGAPALAGHLKSTAERLNELAKHSVEESDVEEDETDPVRSVQPVAAEPRSRRQGRAAGPDRGLILGYSTTFGEEEDEEDEDAGEIAAPPAQFELDTTLPLSDWRGTETIQQFRSEGPRSDTRGLRNIKPAQHNWFDVDNNIEQFLRSKGLYTDGQFSEAFGTIDPPFGSEETPLPPMNSPYRSPSLNSSGGPQTPESMDAHWQNGPYSRGKHIIWNETTKIPRASGMDMDCSFDDPSIRP